MYLKFWGVKPDGEYVSKKGRPRPAWSYRCARRNAARAAHWPAMYRWRRMIAAIRDAIKRQQVAAVPA